MSERVEGTSEDFRRRASLSSKVTWIACYTVYVEVEVGLNYSEIILSISATAHSPRAVLDPLLLSADVSLVASIYVLRFAYLVLSYAAENFQNRGY